jgi:hypothetical protein
MMMLLIFIAGMATAIGYLALRDWMDRRNDPFGGPLNDDWQPGRTEEKK